MGNRELADDHLRRCHARLKALETLYAEESWADVVRESQEVVELALKALLRSAGIEPPRIHDVSDVLLRERARLPTAVHGALDDLTEASRELRRDRELAFYGADDLTPADFYARGDADRALALARMTVGTVAPHIEGGDDRNAR